MKTNLYDRRSGVKLWAILLAFFIPGFMMAQTTVTIGTGTNYTGYLPAYGYYDYSWSAQIYKESEMGGNTGMITSLAFYTTSSPSNYTMPNQKIYLAVMSDSAFASSGYINPSNVGASLVYSGTITWSSSGWNTITLDNAFPYTGGNLVVLYENRDGNYNYPYPKFRRSNSPQTHMAKYKYQDNSFPTSSGYFYNYRDNIQITFSPFPAYDLMMDAWVSPASGSSPDTAMTIKVRVKNVGSNDVDSFSVKYSVDAGTTIVTETVLDTIHSMDTMVYTFATKANMGATAYYEVGAVVKAPNDTLAGNDTIFAGLWIGNPLSGTYTIGYDSTDDFSSVASAIAALKNFGVSGPVTFLLDDTTFTGKVALTAPINGVSATNTITFKGHGPSSVIRAYNNYGDRDVVRIQGVSHVTFDSLAITSASMFNDYNCGVRIMNADSVTIKNCTITVPYRTSSYINGILAVGSKTSNYSYTNTDYLTIENNTINGGYYGIKVYSSSSNRSKDVVIKNNVVNSFYYTGIYSYYPKHMTIINNSLSSRPRSYGYGIYLYKAIDSSMLAYNKLVLNTTSNGYGIYMSNCTSTAGNPMMVYNNMISIPNASSSPYGFYDYYGKNINFYYNTVSIGNGGTGSRAFYIYGSTSSSTFGNIKIKDNIFANFGNGYSIYLYGTYYPAKVTECDYNDLYTTGTKFARYGSSDKANLAAWQAAATGLGANSKSLDPNFMALTDLHAASIPLNGMGTPIAGIQDDFDGDPRNATTPDMGADEYTPPANEVAIIEYLGVSGGGCGMTSTEPVVVVVRNNGTNNQTNIPVKYTVNGGTVVVDSIASLASLAVDTFTFTTTVNLSTAGLYSIKAYVDMTVDENRANDTVSVAVQSVGSISTFPYAQGFDSLPYDFYFEQRAHSNISITAAAANGSAKGVFMTGDQSAGWNYPYNTVVQAFNGSPTHVSTLYACDVNATSLSHLSMKFDKKMTFTSYYKYGWFRILVNDTVYLKDLNGDSVWHAATNHFDPFAALNFDLTPYAGTQFTLKFQGAFKLKPGASSYYPWGDAIRIDNLELWEPAANDVGVNSVLAPVTANCGFTTDSVKIKISNFGLDTQYTIPVKVDITYPNGTTASLTGTLNDTLAPNEYAVFQFPNAINTTMAGNYQLVVYTQLATDTTYNNNDTVHYDFSIDAPLAIPYVQDFEIGTPVDYSGYGYISNDSYSQSRVWKQYMSKYKTNKQLNFNKKVGPVTSNSHFIFDFKNAYNSTATIMKGDNVIVLISGDCKTTWDTLLVVDSSNHASSAQFQRYDVSLASYAGDDVHLKFISSRDNTSSQYSSYFYFDNVSIIVPPAISLGPDTAICAGDTLMLDAGAFTGATYLWMRGLDTVGTSQILPVTTPGTYVVYVDQLGLAGNDAINVVVNPKPAASFTGLDSSYCDNEMPSTLIPTPAGGVFTGSGITGTTFDPSQSGIGNHIITYTFTTSAGCVSTASDTTDVYHAPVTTLKDSTICAGDSIELEAGMPAFVQPTLIFSSYIEGSSNNKALELYNATDDTLNLDNYRIAQAVNGNGWQYYHAFPAGATLAPHDVWVIVADQVDSALYDTANADEVLSYPSVVHFNGDDARAIEVTMDGTNWSLVDLIGDPNNDPGSGWDVAGITTATKNHTLIRKSDVVRGTIKWADAAGTDPQSSQYDVWPINTFTYLGSHTATAPPVIPKTYVWSTGDTTRVIKVAPTTTTTYTVTVDNGNCTSVDSSVVTVIPLPVVFLGNDTTIKWSWSLTLDAGNPGADWLWSTGATTQMETFDSTNLQNSTANTVWVEVTENGCSASDTIVITTMDDVSINGALSNLDVEVYPNPTKGHFNMVINGYNGDIQMEIVDIAGQVVFSQKLDVTNQYSNKFDVSKLASGVYYIKLSSNDGVRVERLIIQ